MTSVQKPVLFSILPLLLSPLILGAPLLENRQCQPLLSETFANGDFSANWVQTQGQGVGTITSGGNGSGISLALTTASPASVNVQSNQNFTPPVNFAFDIEASDVSGVMSYFALYSGQPGTSEIDLEMQGLQTTVDNIMCPIWQEGHGTEPIGLSKAPQGWPAAADGPSATFGDFVPGINNRYVVQKEGFDHFSRATYALNWTESSLTWSVNGETFAEYTKADSALWPSGNLPIQIGIWSATPEMYNWMGPYTWEGANQPTFKIHSVTASTC